MLAELSPFCANRLEIVGGVLDPFGVGSDGVVGRSVVCASATMIVLPSSSSMFPCLRQPPRTQTSSLGPDGDD